MAFRRSLAPSPPPPTPPLSWPERTPPLLAPPLTTPPPLLHLADSALAVGAAVAAVADDVGVAKVSTVVHLAG